MLVFDDFDDPIGVGMPFLGVEGHDAGVPVGRVGQAIWEVVLTAKDKAQDLERITLYVTKEGYEPLYILLQQRAHPTRNAITVTGYQTGQKYADTLFTFDRKQYPSAEIIDLR